MNRITIYDLDGNEKYSLEAENNTYSTTLYAMYYDGVDCRNLYLNSIDLSKCRLEYFDFTDSIFCNVNLIEATLFYCIFNNVHFIDTVAKQADFSHIIANGLIIEDCDFSQTDFTRSAINKSIINRTDLTKADFHWATLIDTKFDENTIVTEASFRRALINPSSTIANITPEQRYWARSKQAREHKK